MTTTTTHNGALLEVLSAGGDITLDALVITLLDNFVDDFDVPAIIEAYGEAIDEALKPLGMFRAGNSIITDANAKPDWRAAYEVVQEIDFWAIAEKHDKFEERAEIIAEIERSLRLELAKFLAEHANDINEIMAIPNEDERDEAIAVLETGDEAEPGITFRLNDAWENWAFNPYRGQRNQEDAIIVGSELAHDYHTGEPCYAVWAGWIMVPWEDGGTGYVSLTTVPEDLLPELESEAKAAGDYKLVELLAMLPRAGEQA